MKFFPVMLLACIVCASSVFAYSNKLNDAEERRAVVSRLDSSKNPSRFTENAVSDERARDPEHVQDPKRQISSEGISLEAVLLNEKVPNSESPEKESRRNIHLNNKIVQLEETANEPLETKSSRHAPAAITEGRMAKLGLKIKEEIKQMLINLKSKINT